MINFDEKIIVLDTETTNSIDDPFCYDVGFAVVDALGRVYETHSYVVADIFLDKTMMENAYFKEKIPQYWEDIRNGKRILRRFKTIRAIFRDVVMQYGVKKIFAHNARFDYRSMNYTQRLLTSSKYRYFFPWGIEFWDTLKMSRQILKDDEKYRSFCLENGYVYNGNTCRYTAEIIHRFLSGDNEFIENHTGLEDTLIEKDIMAYCFGQNAEIDGRLW